jgi:general secretion pathway protein G
MKRSLRTIRRRRGFTLIELLLVLVILAVLAAVVIPNLTGRVAMAKRNASIATIANLKSAIDTFEIDNGRLPSDQEGLDALIVNPGNDITNWNGPYVKGGKIPTDGWGNALTYQLIDKFNYNIISGGEDGQEGTDDDININTEK